MLTEKEIVEMRKMYQTAADGLVDAKSSAAKLALIGVSMDISKLESEVVKLKTQLDAAEVEYANQTRPKQFKTIEPVSNPAYDDDENVDLATRVVRLEMLVQEMRTELAKIKAGAK